MWNESVTKKLVYSIPKHLAKVKKIFIYYKRLHVYIYMEKFLMRVVFPRTNQIFKTVNSYFRTNRIKQNLILISITLLYL